jgi:type I restriction enzyme M protein
LTKPLAKWLMTRYSGLWWRFHNAYFDYEEALETLRERDPKTLSVILSDLRKSGWLTVELDPETSRKRRYHLKPPEVAIDEIAADHMKPLTEFFGDHRKNS